MRVFYAEYFFLSSFPSTWLVAAGVMEWVKWRGGGRMMSDNKYTHWVDEVRKQETGEAARWPIMDENGFSNNSTILTTIELSSFNE